MRIANLLNVILREIELRCRSGRFTRCAVDGKSAVRVRAPVVDAFTARGSGVVSCFESRVISACRAWRYNPRLSGAVACGVTGVAAWASCPDIFARWRPNPSVVAGTFHRAVAGSHLAIDECVLQYGSPSTGYRFDIDATCQFLRYESAV